VPVAGRIKPGKKAFFSEVFDDEFKDKYPLKILLFWAELR